MKSWVLVLMIPLLSSTSLTTASFAHSEAVHTAEKFVEGHRGYTPSITYVNEFVAKILGTDKGKVQDWLTPIALLEVQNLVYQLILSQIKPTAEQRDAVVKLFLFHRMAFLLAGGVSAVGTFLQTENVMKIVSFSTSAFAYWKYHNWRKTWGNAQMLPTN